MARKKYPLPDLHALRTISCDAYCDPRTVEKALRGEYVRPMILAKIRAVLDKRGEVHLLGVCS